MTPGACDLVIAISKDNTFHTRDQQESIWCKYKGMVMVMQPLA